MPFRIACSDFRILENMIGPAALLPFSRPSVKHILSHVTRRSSNWALPVVVEREKNVTKITLNRPTKNNAFTDAMYRDVTNALNEANRDSETAITAITGAGSFFSAGTDLEVLVEAEPAKHADEIAINFMVDVIFCRVSYPSSNEETAMTNNYSPFIEAIINHEKPLIGLINGPAVGVLVTTLAIYDVILASDKAYFSTPFARLSLAAEGCSSITFPRLMGWLKATEMLMFDKTLSAYEAFERNLVNEVIPHQEFEAVTRRRLEFYANFNAEAMRASKRLLRVANRQELLDCARREMAVINKQRQSEPTRNSILQFLQKREKKQKS